MVDIINKIYIPVNISMRGNKIIRLTLTRENTVFLKMIYKMAMEKIANLSI
jgi:hypothetical protein